MRRSTGTQSNHAERCGAAPFRLNRCHHGGNRVALFQDRRILRNQAAGQRPQHQVQKIRGGTSRLVRQHGGPTLLASMAPDGGISSTIALQSMGTWGFLEFMRRKEMEKPKYLKDDTIIIRYDIAVLNKPVVRRHGLERLPFVCNCKDDLCKRLHAGDRKSASPSPLRLRVKEAFRRLMTGCLPS